MTSNSSDSRDQAKMIIEEFVSGLSDADLDGLVLGRRQLALLSVDGRLVRLRNEPIEVVYERLSTMTGAELKALLKADLPSGTAKKAWIDYILRTIFGRTYTPPRPIKSARTAARSSRTPARPWDVAEYAHELKQMTSTKAGTDLLSPRSITKDKLTELADHLGLRIEMRSPLRDQLIDFIVFNTIGGPGALKRAQSG